MVHRLIPIVKNGRTMLGADGLTLRKCLLGRAPINNWMVLLTALFFLLMSVFFKLESDNFNNVLSMAKDQQALIERQQEIIERLVITRPESVYSDTPAY